MSAYRYVNEIRKMYSGREDKRQEMHTERGTEYPFVIDIDGKDIGCMFLYTSNMLRYGLVEIMNLRIYKPRSGLGSEILRMLCSKADEYNVTLYVMPVADKGNCAIPLWKLKEWYREFGFVGDISMEREPHA